MKIIEFHDGLGNQFFEYIYLNYLRTLFPNEKYYTYINRKRLKLHNGFELSKWFDVDLPPISPKISLLCGFLFNLNRVLKKIHLPLIGVSNDEYLNDYALLHEGWYQNKKYFMLVGVPQFKINLELDKENIKLLEMIHNTNSVAVHIRRGDYLLPINAKVLGGICTLEYYEKAIYKILELENDAKFFFFSDNPLYVENTYSNIEKVVVDCNQGERSFFDVYLMSHCKNMILANSTFSCCAAYLNSNAKHIICPSIWNRKVNTDLSLENWIKI